MNLIVCGRECVHQYEGYCGLESPMKVTDPQAAAENSCIYFTPRLSPMFPILPGSSPKTKHPESL